MKCQRGRGNGWGGGGDLKLKSWRAEIGRLTVNTPSCLCLSLNGSERGFRLLHVTLCCVGVVIMVKWKMPEQRSEEEASGAADGELLQHCWLFAALSFINKVEALWTFGGVMSSLAGSHRGRTSVHTVNSSHIILPRILVHSRSSGLQQGSRHDNQGSL